MPAVGVRPGIGNAGIGSAGAGSGAADAGRLAAGARGLTAGCGAGAAGGAEPGWPGAGLPGLGPVAGSVARVGAPDVDGARLAAGRSEAGRALTPWRYASAMAITVRA